MYTHLAIFKLNGWTFCSIQCVCVCVEHTSTSPPDKYIHLFDRNRPLPVSAIFITCWKLPFGIRIRLRRTSTVEGKSISSNSKNSTTGCLPRVELQCVQTFTFWIRPHILLHWSRNSGTIPGRTRGLSFCHGAGWTPAPASFFVTGNGDFFGSRKWQRRESRHSPSCGADSNR